MPDFAGVDRRQRQLLGRTPGVIDPHQPTVLRRGKHDVSVIEPYRAERLRRVSDDDRHPTGDRHLPQLATGKKTDPSPVRREERRARVVGPGNRASVELIEWPDVELTPSLRDSSAPLLSQLDLR